jgi:prolyl-tRNA synthetase
MQMSKLFLPTMREVPADANVISHQLMLRAGLIRKLASGIYTYLPLGLRVIKKISSIIEQEMNHAGAQEILMPMVQPAELWEESGRFSQYGPELLRFKDRKDSWYCLGPTHEEVVTALVRDHIKSYKNLPLTLYQVQTKFRDEIRPRFGLMRGREFIMKDAYSFCADKKSQDIVYQAMWDAYHRIFERCGLMFRAVNAATGSIGGDLSHEFQVLANSGEDAIASCSECNYAANVELAKIKEPAASEQSSSSSNIGEVKTPGIKSVSEQASYLGIGAERIIKSLAFLADEKLVLALVPGDQEISEAKLKSFLKAQSLVAAPESTLLENNLGPSGFVGAVHLACHIKVVADFALRGQQEMVTGANKADTHFGRVNVDHDIKPVYADIKQVIEGDCCGDCGAPFKILRGIEVGHIFYLGKKYSTAFGASVQTENGMAVMEMGCYGIGVGRTAAAAIEQNHDEKGIIWPAAIAPYHVHIVQLGIEEDCLNMARLLYDTLIDAGIETLWDDRDERAGVKLNDADLIGCPLRITVGKRGIKNNELEVLPRNAQKDGPIFLPINADYVDRIKDLLLA